MTIRTPPSRTTTPVAPRRSAPDALVVRPARSRRAVPVAPRPLRREGPAKLTGAAKYADDLVFPGAWYGATIRSTDAHARFLAHRPRPGVRLVEGRRRHRGRHPGRQHRQPHQRRPAGPRPGRRRDPPPRRAARPPRGAGPRDARGPPRRRVTLRTEPLPPVFDPLVSDHVFAHYEIARGRRRRGLRRGRPRHRGHVPRRPPGAAVHREQRDDRRAARGRRRHRPRLAPVPVLHPQGAEAVAAADTTARPRSSRRRPAAGSAARRSTPRSSPSTRRCSRAGPASRSG